MFSTPAERFEYEDALGKHEEMMDAETSEGRSYRFGYIGKSYSENPLLSYEYWRAGRDNARRHMKAQEEGE